MGPVALILFGVTKHNFDRLSDTVLSNSSVLRSFGFGNSVKSSGSGTTSGSAPAAGGVSSTSLSHNKDSAF